MSGKRAPPPEDHPLKPLADLLRSKVDQADAKVLGGSAACGCGDDGAVRRFDYMRAKDAIRALVADPQAFGLDLTTPSEDDKDASSETQGLLEKEEAKKAAAQKSGSKHDALPSAGEAGDRLAAANAANEALAKLVRAGLLFRAERRFQKPKPGRKRRVKWPRTLVPLCGPSPGSRPPPLLPASALAAILAAPSADADADAAAAAAKAPQPPQPTTDADADTFYVWSYDRPTSWLFYAGAGALLLGCAAVPLYPLAPHPVRLAVLYLLLALLSVIVGTVAIRGVVFSAVWILTGHSLWLLPNLLSEEVPLSQVLKPLVSLKAPKPTSDGRKRALRVAARVGTGAVVLGVGALLARHGPSGGELRKAAGEANDALLAYMETMAGGATKRLHNGTDDSAAMGGKGPGGGGAGAGAKGGAAASAAGGGGKGGSGKKGAAAPPAAPPPIPEDDDEDGAEEDKFDDAREEADQEEDKEDKKEEL